ncbi:MAG: RNase III inhibitor [Clostridiales bacterium]|nr:RNase III inhibitor [Clostridiales bacterium]
MPYLIVRQDISRMQVDAVVSPTPQSMLPGDGGASGAIFAAAGPELARACALLGRCPVGQASLTPGYLLPAAHVIHAPSPRWQDGTRGEEAQLRSAWQAALALAARHGFDTVAFPLLGAGAHGFPHEVALHVAAGEINSFLLRLDRDMTIYLAVFSRSAYSASQRLAQDVRTYVDDHYVDEHLSRSLQRRRRLREDEEAIGWTLPFSLEDAREAMAPPDYDAADITAPHAPPDASMLEKTLRPSPGFAARMIALIDSRGMTDPEVYKRANLTKQAFYKVKNELSQPRKSTALALCIGLRLSLSEAEMLLALAGYAFSPASKPDLIVRYFIERRLYDVMEINSVLFQEGFESALLGSASY